jgi:hypothetical protein
VACISFDQFFFCVFAKLSPVLLSVFFGVSSGGNGPRLNGFEEFGVGGCFSPFLHIRLHINYIPTCIDSYRVLAEHLLTAKYNKVGRVPSLGIQ